jgi:nucleoside-diphosphate-sugar epimerase
MSDPLFKKTISLPSVLILGGVGFIGRHLVAYLVDNNLAEFIRVADKALPTTSYLSPKLKKAFEDPRVEFKQANLTNQSNSPTNLYILCSLS